MKKILATLVALAIFSSSATSVVSCGPITFGKLMTRQMPTDVYRGTYKLPISSWSSAVTMQLDDAIILTNTQDTLLATDQHNNFEGDLADAWETDATSTTWRFHVRDDENVAGRWTALDGSNQQIDKGIIKPEHFFNAFRFIFNPNNMSQTIGILQGVIKYGAELNKFISNIRKEGHPLYNIQFTKQSQDRRGEIQSSFYIDRAILAFNISPEDPFAAQKLALELNVNNQSLFEQSFAEGKIINNSAKNPKFNLEFNLSKPAPYFESMGAFLSFAPLPDAALDYLTSSLAGTNYGAATKDGKFGYQNIYYSGAYVVTNYNPTLRITLEKNKNYFNLQNVTVNNLIYSYVGNVDVSRQRFYFETGDISEVDINPNDLAGWDKYVGTDPKNPRFQGANFVHKPQIGTMALFYNYNSTLPGSDDANVALAQRSTRGFIRYVLDRSKLASYYSKAMDQGPTSALLRNNWTSKNLSIFKEQNVEKDYVQYIQENYYQSEKAQKTTLNAAAQTTETVAAWLKNSLEQWGLTDANYENWTQKYGEVKLDDGYDGLLQNDLLGALVFTNADTASTSADLQPRNRELFEKYVHLIGKYDSKSEDQKFNFLKQQVKEDLQKYGINHQVNLKWLADGTASTTVNNHIKDATRGFNQHVGSDSPIRFEVIESADSADYHTKTQNGKFSITISGWAPDYSDPLTFLTTTTYKGELTLYNGINRVFTTKEETQNDIKLVVNPDIPNPEAYQDLLKRVEYFTNKVTEVDKKYPKENERYQEFAKVENFGILESMLIQPTLFKTLDDIPQLSYVDSFSRSTYTSGQAIYRFVGVRLLETLRSHEQFNKAQKDWIGEKTTGYLSMYPGKDGKLIPKFNGKWNA